MIKQFTAIMFFIISTVVFPQVTSVPQYSTENDSIVIYFDAAQGGKGMMGYTGDIYAHTGVNTNVGNWQHVIGSWGSNTAQPKLERVSTDYYKLVIGNPRSFYKVTSSTEHILQLCFVFRSANASQQSEDLFVTLYEPGISVVINNPTVSLTYGDPLRSPGFVGSSDTADVDISAAVIGTKISSLKLFINNAPAAGVDSAHLIYRFIAADYNSGANNVTAIATDTAGNADTSSGILFINPPVENASLPAGIVPGINYLSDNSVVLALFAPKKEFVYVLGDFNDWKVNTNYYMKKYEVNDSTVTWWLQIDGLTSGSEYIFQYLVDGTIRIADPYTEKISDPWNDEYITAATYPGLKAYPDGKTSEIASYIKTGEQSYQWTVTDFEKPAKTDLVIYELLVRDFLSKHDYKTLKDTISYLKTLGVNAIELMPINEFEGNSSGGYNPSFYFAPDKYYGPKEDMQAFIDACHAEGIAVFMDIVLNHAYGSNPMVRLYYENGKPTSDNPWFNEESNFKNPDAQWGFDFNHESIATQYFVDRLLKYWITEYRFDGFRFDFTKGFGNNIKPATGDNNWGSLYDADRVRLLKRMVDQVWAYDSTSFMIFEHLAENKEELELANYGILLWGNMNYQYNEATMGYASDLTSTSYKSRGWNEPNLVAYMESHDEERLMYKNITYGAKSGDYNIKDTITALKRIKLAAAFFFTIPGPKMIWQFGELGYDVSIEFNGRVSEKPIRWNYLDNDERYKLYQTYAALIDLKKNEAFSSSDFTMNVNGTAKRLRINHPSMNVIAVGNFALQGQNIIPDFNNTGTWFDYFSGDSLEVTSVSDFVYLEAGEFHIYTSVKLPTPPEGILTDVQETGNNIVTDFTLEQNYPNPFNPVTNIKYSIPGQGMVTIKVYDILGSEVATLVNEEKIAGTYEIRFNAGMLSSGVYFYTIKAGSYIQTKKMLLLR